MTQSVVNSVVNFIVETIQKTPVGQYLYSQSK
jgi:hypothetical protein